MLNEYRQTYLPGGEMSEEAEYRMAEAVGPFYTAQALVNWLGISQAEIDEKIKSHELLGCASDEGEIFFPVWQFTDCGELVPGLAEVIEALAAGTSVSWTWGLWLTAKVEYTFDGKSAAQWLREGKDKEVVLLHARRDASRWAQ
jgi:hypothetical protein